MQRSKRASRNPESSESAWAAWLEVEERIKPTWEEDTTAADEATAGLWAKVVPLSAGSGAASSGME